jgi:hypothetical protein
MQLLDVRPAWLPALEDATRPGAVGDPADGPFTYAWRHIDGGHHFCKTCGVAIARTASNYFSINARCLDDTDIFTLKVRRYDGRTDMPGGDMPPLAEQS